MKLIFKIENSRIYTRIFPKFFPMSKFFVLEKGSLVLPSAQWRLAECALGIRLWPARPVVVTNVAELVTKQMHVPWRKVAGSPSLQFRHFLQFSKNSSPINFKSCCANDATSEYFLGGKKNLSHNYLTSIKRLLNWSKQYKTCDRLPRI